MNGFQDVFDLLKNGFSCFVVESFEDFVFIFMDKVMEFSKGPIGGNCLVPEESAGLIGEPDFVGEVDDVDIGAPYVDAFEASVFGIIPGC